MEIFEAKDVEDAIEMAEAFKAAGRYDWFRGQTQPWPPYSTAFRRRIESIEAFSEVGEVYHRFEDWVHSTPGLEALASDENAIMAVAQHHGLATHFIDFTTEPSVAGFFAVNGQTPENEKSCLYCLNTPDLLEDWAITKQVYQESGHQMGDVECIRLSLPQLWRLQSQAGVFLFANTNWDYAHQMDRILFPNTGCPSYPTKEEIYPTHKSPLELMLDHYFELEARRKRMVHVKAFTRQAGFMEFSETPPEGYFHPDHFVVGGPPILDSWAMDKIDAWLRLPDDTLTNSRTVELRLDVDLNKEPASIRRSIEFGIRRALDRDPELRKRSIKWVFGSNDIDPVLANAIAWLWAGLRVLPFKSADIADGIGVCAAFHKAGLTSSVSRFDRPSVVAPIIGPAIVVEFASSEGNGGKGIVGKENIREAVRSDIDSYLRADHRKLADNIEHLLLACFNPSRLLQFDALASLFAKQIAPAQVLTEQAVTFSPARLLTFGIP